MALNFYELARSREVSRAWREASTTLKWIGMYSTDEVAVAAGLLAVAPLAWDGLPRQRYKLNPLGAGVWMCDVEYSLSPFTQTDSPSGPTTPDDTTNLGPEYSFDITAGQVHIVQSLSTRYRWTPADAFATGKNLTVDAAANTKVTPDGYAPVPGDVGKVVLISAAQNDNPAWVLGAATITAQGGGQWTLNRSPAAVGTAGGMWSLIDPANTGTGPDYKQAIGVTFDRVEGTDIYAPKFEFGIAVQIFPLNLPYMRLLRSICAKVNASPWRGFAAGEVIYLGATGRCAPGNVWTVSHKFAVGENLYAVPVSVDAVTGKPKLVVPYKGAWEYLWCAYGLGVDANAPVVTQTPSAAFVEKVYRYADFTLLGLGA